MWSFIFFLFKLQKDDFEDFRSREQNIAWDRPEPTRNQLLAQSLGKFRMEDNFSRRIGALQICSLGFG